MTYIMCIIKFKMHCSETRTFTCEQQHVCVAYTTSIHNSTQIYHQDNNSIITHIHLIVYMKTLFTHIHLLVPNNEICCIAGCNVHFPNKATYVLANYGHSSTALFGVLLLSSFIWGGGVCTKKLNCAI